MIDGTKMSLAMLNWVKENQTEDVGDTQEAGNLKLAALFSL